MDQGFCRRTCPIRRAAARITPGSSEKKALGTVFRVICLSFRPTARPEHVLE
jgi:hypothetical protein